MTIPELYKFLACLASFRRNYGQMVSRRIVSCHVSLQMQLDLLTADSRKAQYQD